MLNHDPATYSKHRFVKDPLTHPIADLTRTAVRCKHLSLHIKRSMHEINMLFEHIVCFNLKILKKSPDLIA